MAVEHEPCVARPLETRSQAVIDAERRLRELLAAGDLRLPAPGSGNTRRRFRQLHHLAATEDLSVARLAEAHCDADAIVAESGASLPDGVLAGVWASRYGGGSVTATPATRRRRPPAGTAAGSAAAPRCWTVALIDARLPDGREQLFLVPLRDGGIHVDTGTWQTPALAATATSTVELDLNVGADAAVGDPGFYLDRPRLLARRHRRRSLLGRRRPRRPQRHPRATCATTTSTPS